MIGVQVGTDVRKNAGRQAAGRFNLAALAGEPIHVGGRAAEIRNHAGEPGHAIAHLFYLANHRILGAALDNAAFVFSNRAEGTAAEATALNRDRKTNHLVGRDFRLAIGGVWHALVGQLVDRVHLFGGQWNRRRIQPHVALTVALHQRARVTGVGFHVQDARGMRVQHRVGGHRFVGGQANNTVFAVRFRQPLLETNNVDSGFSLCRHRSAGGRCRCRSHLLLARVGILRRSQRAGLINLG